MFSSRLPRDLAGNRIAFAVARARAAGQTFIDLTESNPTRAGFQYPADLLQPLAGARGRTYAPSPLGSLDARRAVAADYARRGIDVAPERIVLTASTSEAYSLLFKLLADPGDDVLVPHPSYPLFEHLTHLDAVEMHPYLLEYQGRWMIDLASVDRATTPRTRALLIVSPNNPTGSFVRRDELDEVAASCARRSAALVSDEVFADYELEPGAARGAGRALDRDDVLTFTLGGLSKSVGLPQLKLGWMAVGGPDDLAAEALERLEVICDAYLSVSTPVQESAAELLSRGAAIRDQIQARIVANLGVLKSLAASVPACRVLQSEGGWSAVVRVPTLGSEEDLVIGLLHEHGVLVHPGYFFDFAEESYLIVSLLVEERAFAEGIQRILRHFDCTASHVQRSAEHRDD